MNEPKSRPSIRIYFCRNAVGSSAPPVELAEASWRDDAVIEALPCSGKIDPRYMLKAFEGGGKAIAVLTCASGHCKHMEGNLRALRRVLAVREYLIEAGLNPHSAQVFIPDGPTPEELNAAVRRLKAFIERQLAEDGVKA